MVNVLNYHTGSVLRSGTSVQLPIPFDVTPGSILFGFVASSSTFQVGDGFTKHNGGVGNIEFVSIKKTATGDETSIPVTLTVPRTVTYTIYELRPGGTLSTGNTDPVANQSGLPANSENTLLYAVASSASGVSPVGSSTYTGSPNPVEAGDILTAAQGGDSDDALYHSSAYQEGSVTSMTASRTWATGPSQLIPVYLTVGYWNAPQVGNAAPTANAGADQNVTTGTQVTLTGSASSDSDGTIASYSWTQTGGTGVTLSGSGASRTFTPASAGTYTFQLTVTDDDGATASDTVVVTATAPGANNPPTANAGADQTVTVNNQVTLSGTASSDSDGSIASYSWTQLSGTTVTLAGSGATRTFTPASAGTYVFGLTVTDDDGSTSSQDTVTITANPVSTGGANPPSATNVSRGTFASGATSIPTGFTPTSGRMLLLYTSSAATMTVPGWSKHRSAILDIELALFTKTSDGTETSIPFTQNAARAGSYTIVEFPAGSTVSTGTTTSASGTDNVFSAADTTGFAGGVNKVVLWALGRGTSSASSVAAGSWGSNATEMAELASAHEGGGLWLGFYEGTATSVSASVDTSASTGFSGMRYQITVAVTPPPVVANVGPTAFAGNDQTVGVNTQVTLNGGGSTDSDGSIVSYTWSQIGGTGVTLSGSGSTRTFTATTAGSRTFQLTVTDDDGATASDTVVVNVTSSNAPPNANAGADQTVTVGTQVTLNASSSSDSDGTIASYSWTQTAGSTVALSGTGASRTFTPTSSGSRTFQVTVTDDDGSTATDTVVITVNDPASNYGSTVASENTRAGDPSNMWWDGLSPLGLPSFPRRTYYAPGETARFSVDCNSAFNVTIHRLGHYGGNGARLVETAFAGTPATQPAPVAITGGNGAVTCAAWEQNAQWTVPGDALPGWYMATFRRTSDSQHGYALFLVSDAGAKRPTLIVTGDATWHAAYNGFGGNNVYGASVSIGSIGARAFCSTYDKPVLTHAHVPQTHFFNNSYPYLAWSERMGYDAGVATIEQIKDDPTILDGRDLIVWVGHNEYVPQQVMDKTKALLTAGQNMLNIAGNDFFWRVKFTNGAFSSTTNGRVMWCKKDTMSGPSSGPDAIPSHVAGQPFTTAADWTGTWQDTRWTLREPSEDFFGDQFIANGIRADAVKVPASMKNNPAWRNCPGILALTTGQEYTFAAGTLGMEWDRPMMANTNVEQYLFSSTEIDLVNNAADANGETYGQTSNDTIHGFAMVKKGEGYVANFNSDQWAWALSQRHLRGNAAADNNAMQMMLNVIADLGVQPTSASVTAAGLTVPTAVSLAEYGFDVTTDPGGDPGSGGTPTSPTWQELIDLGYTPHITVLL